MSELGRRVGVGFGVAAITMGVALTACSKEKPAEPAPSASVAPNEKDLRTNVTRTGMSAAPPNHSQPCSGASCTHHRRGGYGGGYGEGGDGGGEGGGGGDGGGGGGD